MYTSPLPRNLDTIEETLLGVHAALEGLVRFGLRCCDEPLRRSCMKLRACYDHKRPQ